MEGPPRDPSFNSPEISIPCRLTSVLHSMTKLPTSQNMAQQSDLTPPATQKLAVDDDFDNEEEPVVADSESLATAPLFQANTSPEPATAVTITTVKPTVIKSALKLPGKWNANFNMTLFSDLIEDVIDNKHSLRKFLGKNVAVTVYDKNYSSRDPEVILFDELFSRAQKWLDLVVPGSEPGETIAARDFYQTAFTCLRWPFFEARRLAWQGLLSDVPNNVAETLKWIGWTFESKAAQMVALDGCLIQPSTKFRDPKSVRPARSAKQTRKIVQPTNSSNTFNSAEDRPARPVTRENTGRVRKLSPKAAAEQAARAMNAEADLVETRSKVFHPKTKVAKPTSKVTCAKATLTEPTINDGNASDASNSDSQTSVSSKISIKLKVTPPTDPGTTIAQTSSSEASVVSAFSTKSAASSKSTAPVKHATKASPAPLDKKSKREATEDLASIATESASFVDPTAPVKRAPKAASISPDNKRKREGTEDSSPVAKKAAKRCPFDLNNNNKDGGYPSQFAQLVKHYLNSVDTATDSNAFDIYQSLCPEDGPGSNHHAEEVQLAATLKFTARQYQCQKYRFFFGAACLTEQNIRDEQRKEANSRPDKRNFLKFNKTACQLWVNVDVNKASTMYTKFKEFGWIPEMILEDNKKKSVNPVYKTLFPAAARKDLLNKLSVFEKEAVTKTANHIVIASQD